MAFEGPGRSCEGIVRELAGQGRPGVCSFPPHPTARFVAQRKDLFNSRRGPVSTCEERKPLIARRESGAGAMGVLSPSAGLDLQPSDASGNSTGVSSASRRKKGSSSSASTCMSCTGAAGDAYKGEVLALRAHCVHTAHAEAGILTQVIWLVVTVLFPRNPFQKNEQSKNI